jgi:Mg-chelatase subunit ChlD
MAFFVVLTAYVMWSVLLPPPVKSQAKATPQPSSAPAVSSGAVEINREGYKLKPVGLAVETWPTARFEFSVERNDPRTGHPSVFKGLKASDIQVKLDGQPVDIREGDLKLRGSEPSSVLLLVDASGSMRDIKTGFTKLDAAKRALKAFVSSLGANDVVALAAFDDEPYMLGAAKSNKTQIAEEIDLLDIRPAHFLHTRLYDAVDFALEEARKNKIRNVIVVSDGWEDSPDSKKLSSHSLDAFKRDRERRIAEQSRNNGVKVFTIAIGDEYGEGLSYVDRLALANISKGASGGDAVYIDLPDLVSQASGDEEQYRELLLGSLTQTLENIRETFRYAYWLNIRFGSMVKQDENTHTIWIAPTAGTDPRIQLPVEYIYSWLPGMKVPEVGEGNVKSPIPIFIEASTASTTHPQVAQVYLAILALLGSLALIPQVGKLIAGGGEAAKVRKSIVSVGANSPYIDKECQNEIGSRRYLIKPGSTLVVCPNCKSIHHLSCWHFNHNKCMKRTCQYEMPIPPSVLDKYGVGERELRPA